MMESSTGDYVVLNVGKYGIMPSDSNLNTSTAASMSQGFIDKVKQKFTRSSGSEKNLTNKHHAMDGGTGTIHIHVLYIYIHVFW